jgi:hypothetical protein
MSNMAGFEHDEQSLEANADVKDWGRDQEMEEDVSQIDPKEPIEPYDWEGLFGGFGKSMEELGKAEGRLTDEFTSLLQVKLFLCLPDCGLCTLS